MKRVIAYHVVFSTYGFWLPNDPRGSNSSEVRADNIKPFGKATLVTDTRRSVAGRPHDRALRLAAKKALKYPEVVLNGVQAAAIGSGFAEQTTTSQFRIHACAILPQHMHLVVGRHHYDIEQVVRLLRQAGTRKLLEKGLHPFADQRAKNGRLPSVWGQDFRKVFLFNDDEVHDRIQYVKNNPAREGKPEQRWSFVTPYAP
jgi:REP element-mobilizing transposase RayT